MPTAIAQRFYSPPVQELSEEEEASIEDEEFEPATAERHAMQHPEA